MTKTKFTKEDLLADYRLANLSRQLSLLGRREALGGRANFGIFGDGKEVPQLVLAKFFQEGHWRSGYYRDQTFMMASGLFTPEEFFAQLYGDTHLSVNPGTAGRIMNNHFATRSLDENGHWKDLAKQKNSSADISPTAGQMPRLLGLPLASKFYRNTPGLKSFTQFSNKGNEVAFGMIGDASTSEVPFWETMNAAVVMQVPIAMAVWDDGYGISVPRKYQTTKQSISEALKGFEQDDQNPGILIYKVKGWDYPELYKTFKEGVAICRKDHTPVLFHVTELTQPQGHSTSGSHERYKSVERLAWEKEFDCIAQMRKWIIDSDLATRDELDQIEEGAFQRAREARKKAWNHFQTPIREERKKLIDTVKTTHCPCKKIENANRYNSHLYSESEQQALNINGVPPRFTEESPIVTGGEVLLANYDYLFNNNPLIAHELP